MMLKRKFINAVIGKPSLTGYRHGDHFVSAISCSSYKFSPSIFNPDNISTNIESLEYLYECGYRYAERFMIPLEPKHIDECENEKFILSIFDKLGYNVSSITVIDKYHEKDPRIDGLNQYRAHVINRLAYVLNEETEFVSLPEPNPLYE